MKDDEAEEAREEAVGRWKRRQELEYPQERKQELSRSKGLKRRERLIIAVAVLALAGVFWGLWAMGGMIVAGVIGGIILFVCGVWLLTIAFKESTSCGLFYMFVPFYTLYYAVSRWDETTKRPLIVGLVGLVLLVGGVVPTFAQFKGEVEVVLTEFMEAGRVGDVDTAYACWSSQADRVQIAGFINNNRNLFAGYEGVNTGSWEIESSGGITLGHASGVIIYSGGGRSPFEAWFVKEQGVWKIAGITIGY